MRSRWAGQKSLVPLRAFGYLRDMDKLARERARRVDIVKLRGGEPSWIRSIRNGDIYLTEEDLELAKRSTPGPARARATEEAETTMDVDLSTESMELLSRVFLMHPATEIVGWTTNREGELEGCRIGGCNDVFFRQLLGALQNYDKNQGSLDVPQKSLDTFPLELGPEGRNIFWKVFPYLPEVGTFQYASSPDGTIEGLGLTPRTKPFFMDLIAALKRHDKLVLKRAG